MAFLNTLEEARAVSATRAKPQTEGFRNAAHVPMGSSSAESPGAGPSDSCFLCGHGLLSVNVALLTLTSSGCVHKPPEDLPTPWPQLPLDPMPLLRTCCLTSRIELLSPQGLDLLLLFCLQQEKQSAVEKAAHLRVAQSLIQTAALPHMSCVTLGKLCDLSAPRLFCIMSFVRAASWGLVQQVVFR